MTTLSRRSRRWLLVAATLAIVASAATATQAVGSSMDSPGTAEDPYGASGATINCAVIGFTDKPPTANLAEPIPNSQFPPDSQHSSDRHGTVDPARGPPSHWSGGPRPGLHGNDGQPDEAAT